MGNFISVRSVAPVVGLCRVEYTAREWDMNPDRWADPPDERPADCEDGQECNCYYGTGRLCARCEADLIVDLADQAYDLEWKP